MIDIDALKRDKRPQSSTLVHALIDRLEAAEKERDNANAAAAGVALHAGAMQDRLEAAEKSDAESIAMFRKARDERDALRAKIEAMERQKPAGKFIQHPSNGLWEQDGYGDNPDARPLYALPGAQPAPSVPSVEVELWRQNVLALVKQYGNERATEEYHGDLHCREAPKDVFAEIEVALYALPGAKGEEK